ncbi:hypothetical protein QBC39DRAFT_341310 [Podospora conica]|nr:hypothetical protein QBC39DRAFT_341310 [Schizothecium conicum]
MVDLHSLLGMSTMMDFLVYHQSHGPATQRPRNLGAAGHIHFQDRGAVTDLHSLLGTSSMMYFPVIRKSRGPTTQRPRNLGAAGHIFFQDPGTVADLHSLLGTSTMMDVPVYHQSRGPTTTMMDFPVYHQSHGPTTQRPRNLGLGAVHSRLVLRASGATGVRDTRHSKTRRRSSACRGRAPRRRHRHLARIGSMDGMNES